MSEVAPPTLTAVTPEIARLVLGHFRSGDPALWAKRPHPAQRDLLTVMCDTSFGADAAAMWEAVQMVRRQGGTSELEAIARGEL